MNVPGFCRANYAKLVDLPRTAKIFSVKHKLNKIYVGAEILVAVVEISECEVFHVYGDSFHEATWNRSYEAAWKRRLLELEDSCDIGEDVSKQVWYQVDYVTRSNVLIKGLLRKHVFIGDLVKIGISEVEARTGLPNTSIRAFIAGVLRDEKTRDELCDFFGVHPDELP